LDAFFGDPFDGFAPGFSPFGGLLVFLAADFADFIPSVSRDA
jgi:hypothetical protein